MSAPFADAALPIVAALFDSIWEGALIVGVVWLGLKCLPKLGAATRYAIWLSALVALMLIPVITVGLSERSSEPAPDPAAASAQSGPAVVTASRPRAHRAAAASQPVVTAGEPIPEASSKSRITIPQSLALAITLVWALVASARGVLLLIDVRALAAIRRDAWPWSAAHDYPILLSDRVHVPLAAGFVRPAIILPASIVEQLPADAVETIVIHEVAHLRRRDVWTNALARIAEAFVALNPAAWFVMRRLSIEREIACDDWVVARTGAGDAFAQTLATLAGRVRFRGPLAAPSALGSRHAIVERIERLLDARPRHLRLSLSALGGALTVLAVIALVTQSVSPVLAYAPQPATLRSAPTQVAATCAVRDHGIVAHLFLAPAYLQRPTDPPGYELLDARKVVARFGAANVATFDLTVDAAGKPRKVTILSAPPYPGMAEHVTHLVMSTLYGPALHNCVPVAATIRTAVGFGTPEAGAFSIVAPSYPKGWSARYASACKVPSLLHGGVPAFPDSMKSLSVAAEYSTSVRVHVDAAGAVTNAAIVKSSGQPALDDAVVAAAQGATYPLTESSGFKQVRPPRVTISWNAANGSNTYTSCKPLPTDYVWNTTFARIVPIGLPSGWLLGKGFSQR